MQHMRIGREGGPAVVFAHGWARSHHDFIPAAEALAPWATSYLLDLPGFGGTARPEGAWGTADYARGVLGWMERAGIGPAVWVGHSFGGRMGLRAARLAPERLTGLVLVASAGIPRARRLPEIWRGRARQRIFKLRRDLFARSDAERAALERRYGSPDYIHSGQIGMRDIFLATIGEDQSAELPRIALPTVVINGAADRDTPPETGRRIAAAIPGADYVEMPALDHLSVLTRGHHQIALAVRGLIGGAA